MTVAVLAPAPLHDHPDWCDRTRCATGTPDGTPYPTSQLHEALLLDDGGLTVAVRRWDEGDERGQPEVVLNAREIEMTPRRRAALTVALAAANALVGSR